MHRSSFLGTVKVLNRGTGKVRGLGSKRRDSFLQGRLDVALGFLLFAAGATADAAPLGAVGMAGQSALGPGARPVGRAEGGPSWGLLPPGPVPLAC